MRATEYCVRAHPSNIGIGGEIVRQRVETANNGLNTILSESRKRVVIQRCVLGASVHVVHAVRVHVGTWHKV